MKRIAGLLLALTVMLAALACAEAPDLLSQLNGRVFEFSSGVGAWGTELIVSDGGAFTGSYHDSEMGETGEGYPSGTLYGCSFHGQLSDPVQVNDYTWTVRISVELDEGQVPEAIEDEIRYVTTSPYGVENAETVTVYLPGTPVDSLPEDLLFWTHLQEIDPDASVLPYYTIWSEADEAGFVSMSEADSGAGETANVRGSIEDGCYVLTVSADDEGEWRADDMFQDDSVVKLEDVFTEDGVFTARYAPTGDGQVSVSIRHYNSHRVCDEIHTFDLLVEGGQIKEAVGGSYTASPDASELDPYFSGEWMEKETQFTTMFASMENGGWNVEITSPLSHGAWKIRATAYYDCDYEAFVYADGVKYDLKPGEKTEEVETDRDLWGTLEFRVTEEGLDLEWSDMEATEGKKVLFEKAPGLPPYAYTGTDPIEGAVANALAGGELGQRFLTSPGYVTIPCPIIHKTEMTDDSHAKVYGSFWILNYVKKDGVLESISGGEYPAIITLEKAEDGWRFVSMEEAGDGDDYAADIVRFAGGDKELEEKFFSGADLLSAENAAVRTRLIRAYVEANGLNVTAYHDFGWDPVELN